MFNVIILDQGVLLIIPYCLGFRAVSANIFQSNWLAFAFINSKMRKKLTIYAEVFARTGLFSPPFLLLWNCTFETALCFWGKIQLLFLLSTTIFINH